MLVNNNTTHTTTNTRNSSTTTIPTATTSSKQRQSSITSLFRSNSNTNTDHNTNSPLKHSRANSFNKMSFNFKNPFKNNNSNSSINCVSPQNLQQYPASSLPSNLHHTQPQHSSHFQPIPQTHKSSLPSLNLNTNVSDFSEEEEEEEEVVAAAIANGAVFEEEDDEEEEEGHPDIHESTEEDDRIYSSSSCSSSSSSSTSSCSSLNSQSYEEDENDYCYGGYHPTYIGETYGLKQNYKIVRKLGWGHFSTVWLAYDSITETHVLIKIVRSAKHYTELAVDEIKILTTINNGNDLHPGKSHLVKLLDNFTIKGPNGEHVCMVFEVLGENMLNLIKKFKNYQKLNKITEIYGGLPIQLVKHITRQLLLLIDYLHVECGLIHTDIKPENVLIEIKDVEKLLKLIGKNDKMNKRRRTPPKKTTLAQNKPPLHRSRKSVSKIAESPIRSSKPLQSPISTEEIFHRSSVVSTPILEEKISALKIDEEDEEDEYNSNDLISIKIADLGNACWTNLHYTDDIQTRQYRSPEIILGGDWGCSTDIWSLGCLIFELITSDYLFDPKNGPNYDKDDDHLAQIIELLDTWPSEEFLKDCEYAKKFVSTASKPIRLKKIKNLKIWTLDNVLMEKYHLNIRNSFEISRFIKCFLKFEPWERMDCGSLLRHEWLQSDNDEEVKKLDRKYGTRGEYIRGWSSLVA